MKNKYFIHALLLLPLVFLLATCSDDPPDAKFKDANKKKITTLDFGDVEAGPVTFGPDCTSKPKQLEFVLWVTTPKTAIGSLVTEDSQFKVDNQQSYKNKDYPLMATFKPLKTGPFTAKMYMKGAKDKPWTTEEVVLKGRGVCLQADSDSDGIANRYEDKNGNNVVDPGETDPTKKDSDGDGIEDGIEDKDRDGVLLEPEDKNNNGKLDEGEDANNNGKLDPGETDPTKKDSDGDGKNDKQDKFPLDPKR